jgi:hypothetical protein
MIAGKELHWLYGRINVPPPTEMWLGPPLQMLRRLSAVQQVVIQDPTILHVNRHDGNFT